MLCLCRPPIVSKMRSKSVISNIQGKAGRRNSSYLSEVSLSVPNLLECDFYADKPNQKCVAYLSVQIPAGKVYLSPILDCFDEYGIKLDN